MSILRLFPPVLIFIVVLVFSLSPKAVIADKKELPAGGGWVDIAEQTANTVDFPPEKDNVSHQ